MKYSAIIIHGTPSKEEFYSAHDPSCSNSHWIPWLQNQLIIHNIHTHSPEIPDAYAPEYVVWKQELERYPINKETILIGHSCGAGFLCRWMSENKVATKGLFLVAPWLDPFNEKTENFFDFEFDSAMNNRCKEIHLLYSKNDDNDVLESTKKIINSLPTLTAHSFDDKGHFTLGDMGTVEFPELLEAITAILKR